MARPKYVADSKKGIDPKAQQAEELSIIKQHSDDRLAPRIILASAMPAQSHLQQDRQFLPSGTVSAMHGIRMQSAPQETGTSPSHIPHTSRASQYSVPKITRQDHMPVPLPSTSPFQLADIEPEKRPLAASFLARQALEDAEINPHAAIEKALVLLDHIDRKAGLDLLLEALPRLKRGTKEFYDLKTLAASEIEKLAFDAREEPKKRLKNYSIEDYTSALSALVPAFAQYVNDLRGVCADAHLRAMPVILQQRTKVTSPQSARDVVTDWARAYLVVVKESDILEYFRKLSQEQLQQYSGKLIEATNMQPKEMYILFYSAEAPQIPLRLSPALKGHCNVLLRKQLMENNICSYDPAELDGFCNAYAQMQSPYGIDVNPNDVKDDFEEHLFSLCDRVFESNGA